MIWIIAWILCGVFAATVAYFMTDIRKYKRVTIGEAIGISVALIGGWVSAAVIIFALFFILGDWLEENGGNVLFRLKEKPKEKPLIDGEFFEVKDGQLININIDKIEL